MLASIYTSIAVYQLSTVVTDEADVVGAGHARAIVGARVPRRVFVLLRQRIVDDGEGAGLRGGGGGTARE